jgi:glucosamine--fructose-6-phosphate aminotransferase (isomerizing)
VTILVLLALSLGKNRSKLYKDLLVELASLPKTAEKILSLSPVIKEIAIRYSHHRNFMFIGRGYEYPVALEGSLKLKEISYIHAEAYAGGELKHGPLALIDENFPTLALASSPTLFDKTASNIQEIKARGGKTIVVTTKKQQKHFKTIADDLIIIPEVSDQLSPILEAIVVQLFSYFIAAEKGCDIDKPRNLAKSVTVE